MLRSGLNVSLFVIEIIDIGNKIRGLMMDILINISGVKILNDNIYILIFFGDIFKYFLFF